MQAESDERTRAAGVLRKTDAAMGQKLRGLNVPNCIVDQGAELATLIITDRGAKVLDFDHSFAHEHDLGHFRNSSDPGVAEQLRIKTEETLGFLGIAA